MAGPVGARAHLRSSDACRGVSSLPRAGLARECPALADAALVHCPGRLIEPAAIFWTPVAVWARPVTRWIARAAVAGAQRLYAQWKCACSWGLDAHWVRTATVAAAPWALWLLLCVRCVGCLLSRWCCGGNMVAPRPMSGRQIALA
eukprot:7499575-Pyramimonas_sp.AAC.1